jgi:molybdate transport system regulatory protein
MSTRARKAPPTAAPTAKLAVRFRVDFGNQCSIGIGKISLLEAIGRSRSLSQAARDMDMSYRRAWLLIDSMNTGFDTAVISATVGGSGGGGAQLTSFGRELIQAYRELEGRIVSLTSERMSEIGAHVTAPLRRSPAGGAPLRGRLSKSLKRSASGQRGVRS